MLVGYIRVSTEGQSLATQEDIMSNYSVNKVFREKHSATKDLPERTQFQKMLDYLRKGDVVVVYDLSRLTRSSFELEKVIALFEDRGIDLISHKEPFDISTTMGKFIARMITMFNEMQVGMNNDRIKEGIALARSSGKRIGRRPLSERKVSKIRELKKEGLSNNKIADLLNISRRTVIKYGKNKNNKKEL